MKKLWIDDERNPPGPEWDWATTFADGLGLITSHLDEYEVVSFDHDLGEASLTGYNILEFIEMWVSKGLVRKLPTLTVHSANPVGYLRMRRAIDAIEKVFYSQPAHEYQPMTVTRGMDYEPPFSTPHFMEDE